MDNIDSAEGLAARQVNRETLEIAAQVLRGLLIAADDGVVSSLALRKELERKGVQEARAVVVELKFTEPNDARLPEVFWRHHGRSFLTVAAFEREQQKTKVAVDAAVIEAAAEPVAPEDEDTAAPSADESAPSRKTRRQEEARLVQYVKEALAEIYDAETTEKTEYVFDVHNERAGSDFENVDVIAVHWRSAECVDLVSVEVKLDFTAKLVQQARNYMRFSNRVWMAVPVRSDPAHAAIELRDTDPRLFEHIIASGMGILACHRRPGRSYEVSPIHWPTRVDPDPVEREEFLERHRSVFEEARVIAPIERARYPRLR